MTFGDINGTKIPEALLVRFRKATAKGPGAYRLRAVTNDEEDFRMAVAILETVGRSLKIERSGEWFAIYTR